MDVAPELVFRFSQILLDVKCRQECLDGVEGNDLWQEFGVRRPGYQKHLNQYRIISIDVMSIPSWTQRKGVLLRVVPSMIADAVLAESGEFYPECVRGEVGYWEFIGNSGLKLRIVMTVWGSPHNQIIPKTNAVTFSIGICYRSKPVLY